MNNEIRDRLKEIEVEDFVFMIFIVIILLSYIANNYEKNYFINGVEEEKIKYYYLQIFIFLVVVIVNIYYVWVSYKSVSSLSLDKNYKTRKYASLTLTASLFALVAGLIVLYIAVTDTDIDAEISL